VAWIAAVVAALGLIAILIIVTVNVAHSRELNPPALSSVTPLPRGATLTTSLRDCPVTGQSCRLFAAVDVPTGDAVTIMSESLSLRGWPLVAGDGGVHSGCRSNGHLCAKVWPFAYYVDTFGMPLGLTLPLDKFDELRAHGTLVVISHTA
jgi:hypothetical protein